MTKTQIGHRSGETGCFWRKDIPWRLVDLGLLSNNYLYGVTQVQKISSWSIYSFIYCSVFSQGRADIQADRQTGRQADKQTSGQVN